jgi:VIT1/CCC1 family predicted Fe2+/Mn2+ transporter
MAKNRITDELKAEIAGFQKNEITEFHIYSRLARRTKHPSNAKLLGRIASEERAHYSFWKSVSGKEVKPSRLKVFKYYWLARLFGVTFGVKLMERGEAGAQAAYARVTRAVPKARQIQKDEERHEHELLAAFDEELLRYVGSIVLGLNDALVELTGALAGLTFALRNTRLIALAGLVTGLAASLSMAASEYLSTKSEGESEGKGALKSAVYTGITYVVTVVLLISPYLLIQDYVLCLAVTLTLSVLIILAFTYYTSVAKDLPFARRFLEMAGISLGVAVISFGIGTVIRLVLGVEV